MENEDNRARERDNEATEEELRDEQLAEVAGGLASLQQSSLFSSVFLGVNFCRFKDGG